MNLKHLLATLETLTLKEEVSPDDLEGLLQQYKSGEISYDEFKSQLDSLENTDYSMRQGEMGNPDMRDDMRFNRQGGERNDWDQYDRDEEDEYDEFESVSESVVAECPMEDESEAMSSEKPTMNVTMNAGSAESIRQLLDVLSNFDSNEDMPTDPGMIKDPIPFDGNDDPLDGDEDEGVIGQGVGGIAGGVAGGMVGRTAGTALGTAVGGPVGGAIGGAVGNVAGDVIGTAVGSNLGDKATGEDTSDIDEFVNRPNEKYSSVSSVTASGNDLNRSKTSFSSKPYRGDNPMAELQTKLESLYNDLKKNT